MIKGTDFGIMEIHIQLIYAINLNYLLSISDSYKSPGEQDERIIRFTFIQILHILNMSNQDNQNKSISWEEVQGLSWIFYED